MNKKALIICIIVVLIIILAIFMIKLNNLGKDDKENNDIENTALVESKNDKEKVNANFIEDSSSYQYTTEEVEKIKKEINATANTDIYRIEEEPGGRKILQVKPEIQFNVDLAGIIKNGKPEEDELNEILKKIPNSTGIWISNQSRETFLGLLKNNGIRKF